MKHSPIPKQLCSWNEGDGVGFAEPLPPDLDRLFRVSPKLAEALRAMVREFDIAHLEREARAALALLED